MTSRAPSGAKNVAFLRQLDYQGCANRVEQDVENGQYLEASNEDDDDGAYHLQEPINHVEAV